MEVAAPKIKKGYKQTEVGVIPEDWNFEELKGFVQTFIVPMRDKPKQFGGSIPWCRIEDFDGMYLEKSKSGNCVTEQTIREMNLGVNPVGTVLVSCSTVAGVSAIVKKPLVTNQTFIGLVPNELINNQFLYHLMRYEGPRMMREASGTTIVYISREKFEKFKIATPSNTKEQSKIAESLTDTDELIKSLDALIEKKKNIKTATMQQLLTGKTRLPGFSGEWSSSPVGDLFDFYHGRGLPKSALRVGGHSKCVHYGQLFTEYGEQINAVISRTDMSDGVFLSKTNDVLMPTSDVTPRGLATASCIKEDGVILGGGILVMRPKTEVDGSFVSYFVSNNKNNVLKLVKGSTVFHLYANDISKLELSLPPTIEEQRQIVEVLENMKSEITGLEKRRDKLIAIKQGMMHELLTGNTRLV